MAIHISGEGEDDVVSTINTTPLVDVMLVLLIIFLITIPVVTTSIQVQLPKETNEARETRPESIIISVDAQGRTYWHDIPVESQQLAQRLQSVAPQQPEVQIRGDIASDYEPLGRVLYACQHAGISKVAFITEPSARGG